MEMYANFSAQKKVVEQIAFLEISNLLKKNLHKYMRCQFHAQWMEIFYDFFSCWLWQGNWGLWYILFDFANAEFWRKKIYSRMYAWSTCSLGFVQQLRKDWEVRGSRRSIKILLKGSQILIFSEKCKNSSNSILKFRKPHKLKFLKP